LESANICASPSSKTAKSEKQEASRHPARNSANLSVCRIKPQINPKSFREFYRINWRKSRILVLRKKLVLPKRVSAKLFLAQNWFYPNEFGKTVLARNGRFVSADHPNPNLGGRPNFTSSARISAEDFSRNLRLVSDWCSAARTGTGASFAQTACVVALLLLPGAVLMRVRMPVRWYGRARRVWRVRVMQRTRYNAAYSFSFALSFALSRCRGGEGVSACPCSGVGVCVVVGYTALTFPLALSGGGGAGIVAGYTALTFTLALSGGGGAGVSGVRHESAADDVVSGLQAHGR
jgi:hypothetical protein